MTDFNHRLDRIVTIDARPDTVFGFLSRNDHWARWWGQGSTIDPTPGGAVRIRHPNGVEVHGEVIEVQPGAFISFTYGNATGKPIPLGGSRVEIRLDSIGRATRLHLTHHFADVASRDEHVQGWRFQLSLFSNLVADTLHAEAGDKADAWFAIWANPDEAARTRQLQDLAAPDVRFRDRYSTLDGTDDVLAHIAAAQKFMPGVRLTREGAARQCQGMALVDWTAAVNDQPRGKGTNCFAFDADGRIVAVTGFWS